MSWVCELSEDAAKDLRDLPKAIQKRVARVFTQIASDPFLGNVKPLQETMHVLRILLRSGKTYR